MAENDTLSPDIPFALPVPTEPPPVAELTQLAPVPPVNPVLSALEGLQTNMAAKLETTGLTFATGLDRLLESFEEKIKYDRKQEMIIDRLHKDLQDQKDDQHLKLLKPIATDLIKLYDDIDKLVVIHQTGELPEKAEQLLKLFASFQGDIEEILSRYGFTAFVTESDDFDAKQQKALKSVPAAEASQNRKVAQRLRKGFVYEGRVIRPELVSVYVFQASTPSPESRGSS